MLFMSMTFSLHAQTEQVGEADNYYRYAMLSFGTQGSVFSSKGYVIYLQVGGSTDEPKPLTDDNGYTLQFPTWIDAMNYVCFQGWEVVWHNSNTNMMEQWVMKKKVSREQLESLIQDNTTVKQKK